MLPSIARSLEMVYRSMFLHCFLFIDGVTEITRLSQPTEVCEYPLGPVCILSNLKIQFT